ncbi:MAG: helix-turn-helix domain-containing protein [Halothece sp.]
MKVLLVRLQATKVRIYPTAEQRQHLAKSFVCLRLVWNYSLNLTVRFVSCEIAGFPMKSEV